MNSLAFKQNKPTATIDVSKARQNPRPLTPPSTPPKISK